MKSPLAASLLVCGLLFAAPALSSADTITFNNSALHPGGTMTIGSTVNLTTAVIDAVARSLPTAGYTITGTCDGGFGCLTVSTGQFVGPDTSTTINDYIYSGVGSTITITGGIASLGLANNTVLFVASFDPVSNVTLVFDDVCISAPTQCVGSLNGTLTQGLINPILAAALNVNPNSLGGSDQNLFMQFLGLSLPTSGAPSGTALGNTNQIQVVTPPSGSQQSVVPEPGTLILFGTGLVMAARLARRKLRV
jgi:hypothetical protein